MCMKGNRLQAKVLQQHHEISIFPEFCCGRLQNSEVVQFVCALSLSFVCVVFALCVFMADTAQNSQYLCGGFTHPETTAD